MLNTHYRPARFAEVIGRDHVVIPLRAMVEAEQLPYSLLFHGHQGTGKTTLARIIARAVNCSNRQAGEPCGFCDTCTPDSPSFDSLFIEWDCAVYNKVADVEELTRISLGRVEPGQRRVILCDEAHSFTPEAFEKLKKTLEEDFLWQTHLGDPFDEAAEEPTHPTMWIFGTTEIHKLPPAIRSRTMQFYFPPLPPEAIETRLKRVAADQGWTIPEEAFGTIAQVSGGDARAALVTLEQLHWLAETDLPWYNYLGFAEPAAVKRLVAQLWRKEAQQVTEGLQHLSQTTPVDRLLTQLRPLLVQAAAQGQDPRYWTALLDAAWQIERMGPYQPGALISHLTAIVEAHR
jgi:DNA polymerase III gamma/tau subunit